MASENNAEISTPTPVAAEPVAAPTTPVPAVSDIARAQQAKRQARAAEKPVTQAPAPLTRAQVLAELRTQYEEDPESLLASVAGEDFYKLAERVAKKASPPSQEQVQADLLARLKALDEEKAVSEAAKAKATQAEANARTAAHIAEISKLLEATNDEGAHLYPTLATLDPTSVEEDPGVTAYNAVVWAWEQESTQPDGSFVPVQWDEKTTKAKFTAAFEGLESHYAKIRTPKARSAPAQNPTSDEEPSPTIHSNRFPSERTPREPPKHMTQEQAIRFYAREYGIDAGI